MLHKHKIPSSDIVVTSRSENNRSRFESEDLLFRVADYNRLDTLEAAFQNVDNLLFMSSSERDSLKRNVEHGNVIEAAKKANVKRVWYVSLAFGGFGDGSKIGFQQAHYETENRLREYVCAAFRTTFVGMVDVFVNIAVKIWTRLHLIASRSVRRRFPAVSQLVAHHLVGDAG